MTANVARPDQAAPAATRAPLHLPYLDGLRALAALYVVMFHAVLGFCGQDLSGAWRVLRRVFAFGHEAVAVFIVLSGYCLMLPVVRARPERLSAAFGRFMSRRARRILPPYFVTVAGSLLLLALVPSLRAGGSRTIWDDSLPGLSLWPIVSHLLLVHNWFPSLSVQINGPLWSVASEWQIYFFFPLLLLPVWRRAGMLGTLLVAAVIGYLPLLLAPVPAKSAIPWYLLLFVLGMCSAAIGFSDREPSARLRAWPWRGLTGALWLFCAIAGGAFGKIWFAYKPVTDVIVGLATASLLVYVSAHAQAPGARRSYVFELLGSKALVGLGHFSYSLYLTHLPVMALCYFSLIQLHWAPGPQALLVLAVSSLASLPIAYAFYLAFERPFLLRR